MKSIILVIFLVMMSIVAFASESKKNPHHEGLLSSLNIGIRYSSVYTNRGIILYDGFQVDPIVAVFLLDDKLEFLGDSIGYRDFLFSDILRARTRFREITDKPLFPSSDSQKLAHRKNSYEWVNSFEVFIPGYNDRYHGEIDLEYAKDLSASEGNYYELQGKLKVFDFDLPKLGTNIELNLYSSIGWGDDRHNQYFYGPEANTYGFNNMSYGLWFIFPNEADRFYPIVQVKHFQILNQYKYAQNARGHSEGWLVSFIATYGLLE